jgi:hypothetical protein
MKGQWWLEIPINKQIKKIACSYSDYLTAVEGEVPDIYIKGIEKYY